MTSNIILRWHRIRSAEIVRLYLEEIIEEGLYEVLLQIYRKRQRCNCRYAWKVSASRARFRTGREPVLNGAYVVFDTLYSKYGIIRRISLIQAMPSSMARPLSSSSILSAWLSDLDLRSSSVLLMASTSYAQRATRDTRNRAGQACPRPITNGLILVGV
jgi:hypothetical protein